MLLYRIAMRMVQSEYRDDKIIRTLLEQFLELIDKDQHPQLAAIATFVLTGLDSTDEDTRERSSSPKTSTKPQRNHKKKKHSGSKPKQPIVTEPDEPVRKRANLPNPPQIKKKSREKKGKGTKYNNNAKN
eukprot:m.194445 g.194445  ORF g.194445 m.194445 type:complete len:130 (-) comp25800_c1_seq8:135-524(-)